MPPQLMRRDRCTLHQAAEKRVDNNQQRTSLSHGLYASARPKFPEALDEHQRQSERVD
jgi:hypothetical protein